MVTTVTPDAQLFLPLNELVDLEIERKRIEKEMKKAKTDLDVLDKKLGNPSFLSKAPERVISAERERAEKLKSLLAGLEERAHQMK